MHRPIDTTKVETEPIAKVNADYCNEVIELLKDCMLTPAEHCEHRYYNSPIWFKVFSSAFLVKKLTVVKIFVGVTGQIIPGYIVA